MSLLLSLEKKRNAHIQFVWFSTIIFLSYAWMIKTRTSRFADYIEIRVIKGACIANNEILVDRHRIPENRCRLLCQVGCLHLESRIAGIGHKDVQIRCIVCSTVDPGHGK